MKKLTTLLAAAILGTSSLALANPDAPVTAPGVDVRDHRTADDAGMYTRDHRDDRYDDRFDNSDSVDTRDHRDDRFDDHDYQSYDGNDRAFSHDRDGNYWRDGQRFVRNDYQPQWQDLGIAGTGRTRLAVGADAGRFQSLRLDISGWLRVNQVLVRFTDGTEQRVRVASRGYGRRAPLVIDLQGNKQIRAVVVFAAQYGRGRVAVSGLEAKRYYWRRS